MPSDELPDWERLLSDGPDDDIPRNASPRVRQAEVSSVKGWPSGLQSVRREDAPARRLFPGKQSLVSRYEFISAMMLAGCCSRPSRGGLSPICRKRATRV